jgi:hypothetical protein
VFYEEKTMQSFAGTFIFYIFKKLIIFFDEKRSYNIKKDGSTA